MASVKAPGCPLVSYPVAPGSDVKQRSPRDVVSRAAGLTAETSQAQSTGSRECTRSECALDPDQAHGAGPGVRPGSIGARRAHGTSRLGAATNHSPPSL